jgi:hypothetical protein
MKYTLLKRLPVYAVILSLSFLTVICQAQAAAPAAPTALFGACRHVGNSWYASLVWTDNSNNETGFQIEKRYVGASTFTLLNTIGANLKSYTVTASPYCTWSYRIRAFNADGYSAYSNIWTGS